MASKQYSRYKAGIERLERCSGFCILMAFLLVVNSSLAQKLKKPGDIQFKTPSKNETSFKIDKTKQKSDTLDVNKLRVIQRKGMMSNYKILFNTLHGDSQRVRIAGTGDLSEVLYDTVNSLYYGRLSNPNYLAPQSTVFGWHPYWMKEANIFYPYSLLSTIAFFSYDVNENDGTCYDQDAITNWKTTTMIDSAKAYKVKVLLTISSYGADRNKKFLTNKEAWGALGDSLKALLKARSAQGIDVDFSGIPKDQDANFVNFVKSLRAKIGDTCLLTLHITFRDLKNNSLNLSELKQSSTEPNQRLVNLFIIQGYDYEEYSYTKGPMAPLYLNPKNAKISGHKKTGAKDNTADVPEDNSIVGIIDLCKARGLAMQDMLLNLPLYGTVWEGRNPKEMSYDDIVSIYEKNYSHDFDLWSESAIITIPGKSKDNDTVICYESSESLDRKFQWARANGLSGVGLWGLGYDGGHKEVWQAVSNNFGVLPVREITPFSVDNGKFYSILYALQKYRKPVGVGIGIITFFFIGGFLLSLLDWRVREVMFRSYINRALISFVILLFIFATLFFLIDDTRAPVANLLPLFIGLALGGVIVYLTTKLYMNYRKKMP